MKKLTKFTIWIMFLILVFANIYVFMQSIQLSDKINKFEKQVKALHQENLELENKIYTIDSLSHAASLAASLNFTAKAQPVILDNLHFARNQ